MTPRGAMALDGVYINFVHAGRFCAIVKMVLRKYGYSPDNQEKATLTVLVQTKLFGYEWVS